MKARVSLLKHGDSKLKTPANNVTPSILASLECTTSLLKHNDSKLKTQWTEAEFVSEVEYTEEEEQAKEGEEQANEGEEGGEEGEEECKEEEQDSPFINYCFLYHPITFFSELGL